ncbi:hypothetical protein FPZ24_01945 [Sphingomonas panacisoli]|uniref:Uncharacterized protein n=1 Tax=Sphingomonas panacisoli TaxID=1813879 RepID=A0A5B8LEL2_9SPHN|nr:hypothetical protein [Sphingomonas panacisoli]QDZ06386.1 hypothetical protein FPZ24_01945 [Sphingomonas panacisoli]
MIAKIAAAYGWGGTPALLNGVSIYARQCIRQSFHEQGLKSGFIRPNESLVVVELKNELWATSANECEFDVVKCREDTHAALCKIIPDYVAVLQPRPNPELLMDDGSFAIEN